MSFTSQYPPAHNSTYVKATSTYDANYYPHFATDPAKALTGSASGASWAAGVNQYTNQRFHIDLGVAKIIRRLYYENFHHSGTITEAGGRGIVIQGSNDALAFAELTFGTDTNWANLSIDDSEMDIHVSSDIADPKYVLIDNANAYRYYAIKFASCWRANSNMAIRRVELQTEDGFASWIPKIIMF